MFCLLVHIYVDTQEAQMQYTGSQTWLHIGIWDGFLATGPSPKIDFIGRNGLGTS